jgi:hypothetical protein
MGSKIEMNIPDTKVIVSLYLIGDDLDPSKITNELGIAPTESRRKGETRTAPVTGRQYVNKTGLWCLMVDKDHAEVTAVVSQLLEELKTRTKPLHSLHGVQDAYFDVFVAGLTDAEGDATCEFALDCAQLARLTQFGLPIRFTVTMGND